MREASKGAVGGSFQVSGAEAAPDVRGDELVRPLQLDPDLGDLAVPQNLNLRLHQFE